MGFPAARLRVILLRGEEGLGVIRLSCLKHGQREREREREREKERERERKREERERERERERATR